MAKYDYDRATLRIKEGNVLYVYRVTEEQLCDVFGYEHRLEKVMLDSIRFDIRVAVNGEIDYVWSEEELRIASKELEIDEIIIIEEPAEVLKNLFNAWRNIFGR